MKSHFLGNKEIVASESKLHLTSVTIKKNWQTPKLIELDYNQTNNDVTGSGDAAFGDPLS